MSLAAAVPRAVAPVPNRGILLGAWPLGLEDFKVVEEGMMLVPAFRVAAAAAVDLVTRVGLCSEAVTREPIGRVVGDLAFVLRGGTMPRAGNSSPSSSRSESDATRFAAGVFRGCPGGAMAVAFAVAAAMCLLGVTGGSIDVVGGGVEGATIGNVVDGGSVSISVSSSVSAGGVTGVTTGTTEFTTSACNLRTSSTAAHFAHSNCFRYMYCC